MSGSIIPHGLPVPVPTGGVPLIAAMGSSTIARADEVSALSRFWDGPINVASMLSGGRFYFPKSMNFGVSGANSSAILASQLPQVLALSPKPRGCFMIPTPNDVPDGLDFELTKANNKALIAALLARGITPIVGTTQPRLGVDATTQTRLARLNAWIRAYVPTVPGAILVDPVQQFTDPSLTTYALLPAYAEGGGGTSPALHLNHRGAFLYAQAIVAALAGAGWSTAYSPLLASNGDLYSAADNPFGSLNANGLLTGSGGSMGDANISGVIPAGWNSFNYSGATVAAAHPASGLGLTLTMSGTATEAGGTGILIYRDLSAGELSALSPGDTLQMTAGASWPADLSGIGYFQTVLRVVQAGVTTDLIDGSIAGSLTASTTGILPAAPGGVIFRPPSITLTSVPTQVRLRLVIAPFAAGGAMIGAVTWNSACVRKVVAT